MTDLERWKYRVMILEAKRNLLLAETAEQVATFNEEIDRYKGYIEDADVSVERSE